MHLNQELIKGYILSINDLHNYPHGIPNNLCALIGGGGGALINDVMREEGGGDDAIGIITTPLIV